MPVSHLLDLRAMRKAIAAAREIVSKFGTHRVTTAESSYLLQAHNVEVFLEDLPAKHPAILSPIAFRGTRALSLGRHVPLLQRSLVLLHESGHLYNGTAALGVTYDNDDWRSSSEQGADAFAAVALVPTGLVDHELSVTVWMREIEDNIAALLMDWAEGLWDLRRAIHVAKNRLLIRQELGV